MKITQCNHGLNDDCDTTYRSIVEDFINGTKVTIIGYRCKVHDRHGTWTISEPARKIELPMEAES